MINRYTVKENKLKIDDVEITFDFPIKEFIEIKDMLIVYLDLFEKVMPLEENIFGINLFQKKIQWQIEKQNYPKGGYSKMKCPFTGISYDGHSLCLHNWCSTNLIVDPITGKVLDRIETR